MANLKGGTFEKQAKDAFHRVEAFGTSKQKGGDNMTHSDALGTKREMILRDMANFANENFDGGKLNELYTPTVMDKFLDERLEGMSDKSKVSYQRAMSSLVQGLAEKNVSMGVDRNYFDEKVAEVKEHMVEEPIECRYITNHQELHFERVETELFKDVAMATGMRKEEVFEVMKNPEKYLNENKLEGVIGKGNHEYDSKTISHDLAERLKTTDIDISLSTITRDLKAEDITPHDFRYTFTRDTYEEKLASGIPDQQAKQEVIRELNHHRKDMTNYYLKRT